MNKLIEFKTENGDNFFVEVLEPPLNESFRDGSQDNNMRGAVQNISDNFEKALKPLKDISGSIIKSIKDIVNAPDEIEVELGLKFSARAGLVLTCVDSEANLRIALKWKKP